jgi:hypothetical protein
MPPSGPLGPAGDRHWRGGARLAVVSALAFCGLAVLLDWSAGTLTAPRAVLWITLSVAVCTVLLPHRVTAGPGWLMVRGPLRRRIVRTDALVSARRHGDVSAHLVLRDAYGHRLELEPRVLAANPLLWHALDTGFRRSLARGTMLHGQDVLHRLGEQIDDEAAHGVLRASGLS